MKFHRIKLSGSEVMGRTTITVIWHFDPLQWPWPWGYGPVCGTRQTA